MQNCVRPIWGVYAHHLQPYIAGGVLHSEHIVGFYRSGEACLGLLLHFPCPWGDSCVLAWLPHPGTLWGASVGFLLYSQYKLQWNLAIVDTIGTQLAVLYREVSLVQR